MFPAHLRKTPSTLYQLAEDVFKKWTVDFIRGDQVNLRPSSSSSHPSLNLD